MAQQSRREFPMPIALISPTTISERLIRKLTGFTDRHRQALQRIRTRVWWFLGNLNAIAATRRISESGNW